MKYLILLTAIIIGVFSSCAATPRIDQPGTETHMVENGRLSIETVIQYPAEGIESRGFVVFAGGSANNEMLSYTAGVHDNFLLDVFLVRGIAVVFQNKRGIGRSTGNWKMNSMEGRAEDLLAVVDYYRELPGLNAEIEGIIGHSQGGWVVQEAGSRDKDLDFVISLAGPATTLNESDIERTRIELIGMGYEGEELEKRVQRRVKHNDLMLANGGWFPFFEMRLMYNMLPYNPADALLSISMPVLLAYGEFDNMAPAESSVNRLAEIFPSGAPGNVTVHVADGCDHYFRITDDIFFDYEAGLDDEYSAEFLEFYKAWIEENVFSKM